MFGMSFVYIIFDDNTDNYWARTRVLESSTDAQRLLPQDVTPTLDLTEPAWDTYYGIHLMP